MEMTREQAIVEHRQMWRWLAENPSKDKHDYLRAKGINENELELRCFLCTYAAAEKKRAEGIRWCAYCPLDWGGRGCDEPEHSLYGEWANENKRRRRAKLARQIAELPERKRDE